MTAHPIDTEALRRLSDRATPEPWETRGYNEMPGKYVVGPRKPGDLGRGPVVLMEPLFCDERSAADAEFIVAIRTAVPALLDALAAAEAERDEWRQTALDERATALDALEQIKAREARIKAVRDVLDQAEAAINRHPAYTFNGQRMDPIVNGADIRRALDGDA